MPGNTREAPDWARNVPTGFLYDHLLHPPHTGSTHRTPSTSLTDLPSDLLFIFATLTDEPTIWSLMATCRSLRHVAENAIKPYLVEQAIEVQHHLKLNVCRTYSHAYATYADDRKARLKELVRVYQRFTKRFKAYPASASLLRKLTIEIDQDLTVGWDLLELFLQQLEQLSIHAAHIPLLFTSGLHVHNLFADITARWSRLYARLFVSSLPNLTKLSIHTTVGSLHHFHRIAHWIPNLQELSLGEHWQGAGTTSPRPLIGLKLQHLRILSLICPTPMIVTASRYLLLCAPNIRRLTIHERPGSAYAAFGAIPLAISAWADLEFLASYGESSSHLLSEIRRTQADPRAMVTSFDKVKMLALEVQFQPSLFANVMYDDAFRPNFPSLQRISFVIQNPTYTRSMLQHRADALAPGPCVRALFTHYPNLRQIKWVMDYPLDPFAIDDPADVVFIIDRLATTDSGGMAPFAPKLPALA